MIKHRYISKMGSIPPLSLDNRTHPWYRSRYRNTRSKAEYRSLFNSSQDYRLTWFGDFLTFTARGFPPLILNRLTCKLYVGFTHQTWNYIIWLSTCLYIASLQLKRPWKVFSLVLTWLIWLKGPKVIMSLRINVPESIKSLVTVLLNFLTPQPLLATPHPSINLVPNPLLLHAPS